MNLDVAERGSLEAVRQVLAQKPDGVLEAIAREAGASVETALQALPEAQRLRVRADRFAPLWDELTRWGEIVFIVHTADIVLECKGEVAAGSEGRGYFNFHGASPIGGHIRKDHCAAIYLVDRPFHGRRSCSLQFINGTGEPMFKIFVRRDEQRELVASQVDLFTALWAREEGAAEAVG